MSIPFRLLSLGAVAALAVAGCDQATPPASTPAPKTEASAPAPTPPRVPTPLMLTAEGWGPLAIGMSRRQVVEAIGDTANPELVGGAEPAVCDQFRPARAPEGTLVMLENGRLARISLIRGSRIRTERGFGVGTSAADIKAAYGGAVVVQPHKYQPAPAEDLFVWEHGGSTGYVQDPDARGIRYEIGTDGLVMAIHAGGPAIQLVEGCA